MYVQFLFSISETSPATNNNNKNKKVKGLFKNHKQTTVSFLHNF